MWRSRDAWSFHTWFRIDAGPTTNTVVCAWRASLIARWVSARYRATSGAPYCRSPDAASVHGVRLLPANARTSEPGLSCPSTRWIALNQSQSAVPPYAPPSNGCPRSRAIRWRYAHDCNTRESPKTATPRRTPDAAVRVDRVTAPCGTSDPIGGSGGSAELSIAATVEADGSTFGAGAGRGTARADACVAVRSEG